MLPHPGIRLTRCLPGASTGLSTGRCLPRDRLQRTDQCQHELTRLMGDRGVQLRLPSQVPAQPTCRTATSNGYAWTKAMP